MLPIQSTTTQMASRACSHCYYGTVWRGWGHLRPSVISRKASNGFRCEWGAETYAAFRSVVSTATANSASVLDTVRFVLTTKLSVEPLAGVG
jgi:hypothetical protein